MPAYSFMKRFCTYVEEGSKPHTIRAYRKYLVKVGDQLSLYFGMRTQHCRLLRTETCTDVKTIIITERGTVVLVDNPRLSDFAQGMILLAITALEALSIVMEENAFDTNAYAGKPSTTLSNEDKDRLAWRDGFRPEGSSLYHPAGAFALMMDFWRESHEFPFVGNIIYWNPNASL